MFFFYLFKNKNKSQILLQYKIVDVFILVLEDDISGLGRCAILFLSPEELGLEICEAALTEAES